MSAVIIPARYGSSRFPGKVLADIGGSPMILRVAERCLKSKAQRVVVVTDNEDVFKACRGTKGLEVMTSPPDLATGTDRVAFAARETEEDVIINVQGDEPFILPALIDDLIDGLTESPDIDMITAKTLFKNRADAANPSAVKVVTDEKGFALYFSRYPIPYNRDGLEKVRRFRHIGVYGFRREFLFRFAALPRTSLEKAENLEQLRALENGVKIKVLETDYDPVSVDTPADIEAARRYFKEGRR